MLAARAAYADTPGAPDDAIVPVVDEALAVRTPRGFALEGLEGETYLDGFATRMFYRDGHSTLGVGGDPPRLVVDAEASELAGSRIDATSRRDDVELETSTGHIKLGLGLVEHEFHVGTTARFSFAALERAYFAPAPGLRSYDMAPLAGDLAGWLTLYRSEHLAVDLHILEFGEGEQSWLDRTESPDHRVEVSAGGARFTLLTRYQDGPWQIRLDRSIDAESIRVDRGLTQHTHDHVFRFESRDEVRRTYERAHGLTNVEWISGLETHISQYERNVADGGDPRENVARAGEPAIDDVSHVFAATVWRPNLALATGIKANLSPRIMGYVGLRADSFAGDAAFGPRAWLAVRCGTVLVCRLDAGAYRRPAEDGEELEHPELHAERTTRIALTAEHTRGELRFYYADQTRLIVRDLLGTYANTGRGTTYGAYGLLRGHLGKFATQLAIRLEHAERQDAPRLAIRPYEFDQPIRLEARIERVLGGWKLAARFELREGLPYTNVVGASYDSDRDVYTPNFGPLYAERFPWQHQLDLRIDRTWKIGGNRVGVFLDIANVYDHRAAVDWVYNFTFTQRRAVEAIPFWPTLGVRGEL